MENKFWDNFKKIAGGLTVTFSVFFLLLAISFFKTSPNLVATSLKPTTESPVVETENTPSANILSGKFNPETPGNVVYSYGDNKLYHYKTIKDTSLIELEKDPRLMLEIKDNQGMTVWQKTEISWRDDGQGILFFHFKTVAEDGSQTKVQNFTGNYQVILE